MAEEYVSKDQFGEFVRRMEAGFHAQDQRFDDLRQDLRQGMQDLRAEMRELRSTTTRQMWTMMSVVLFAVLTGVIKLVFFP